MLQNEKCVSAQPPSQLPGLRRPLCPSRLCSAASPSTVPLPSDLTSRQHPSYRASSRRGSDSSQVMTGCTYTPATGPAPPPSVCIFTSPSSSDPQTYLLPGVPTASLTGSPELARRDFLGEPTWQDQPRGPVAVTGG